MDFPELLSLRWRQRRRSDDAMVVDILTREGLVKEVSRSVGRKATRTSYFLQNILRTMDSSKDLFLSLFFTYT